MSEFKYYAAGEDESKAKQFDAYLWKQQLGGAPGFAVQGVVAGLGVTQTTTASGSIVVGAGLGIYQGSLTSGVDRLINNADKTIDVLGTTPMGALPRYDIVAFNPATASTVILPGTPNASPTDPSYAGMLPLARLRQIPTGSPGTGTIPNANIDDLRVFTTLNIPEITWQSYPVVWSQIGGTVLSVGSGTITGKYRQVGKQVTVQVSLTRASDTNLGTAAYVFSLPVAGSDISATGAGLLLKSGEKQLAARMINGSQVVLVDTAGNRVSNANPGSWAAGDAMQFTLTYFTP